MDGTECGAIHSCILSVVRLLLRFERTQPASALLILFL